MYPVTLFGYLDSDSRLLGSGVKGRLLHRKMTGMGRRGLVLLPTMSLIRASPLKPTCSPKDNPRMMAMMDRGDDVDDDDDDDDDDDALLSSCFCCAVNGRRVLLELEQSMKQAVELEDISKTSARLIRLN